MSDGNASEAAKAASKVGCWPYIIATVGALIVCSLAWWLNSCFSWISTKSNLDTAIVIISLLGLIVNNLVEAFSAEKARTQIIQFFLIFILAFISVFIGLRVAAFLVTNNWVGFWLSLLLGIAVWFLFAFLFNCLIKPDTKIKKIKSFFYAALWGTILLFYLISIYFSS